jgi:hypothetical protein
MKVNFKGMVGVAAVLAAGGFFVAGATPNSVQMDRVQYPTISCSSPEVIDTLKFLVFKMGNPEVEVVNTGPLGTYGNQLACSGEINGWVRNYFVQPLDNGKFRVSSEHEVAVL